MERIIVAYDVTPPRGVLDDHIELCIEFDSSEAREFHEATKYKKVYAKLTLLARRKYNREPGCWDTKYIRPAQGEEVDIVLTKDTKSSEEESKEELRAALKDLKRECMMDQRRALLNTSPFK